MIRLSTRPQRSYPWVVAARTVVVVLLLATVAGCTGGSSDEATGQPPTSVVDVTTTSTTVSVVSTPSTTAAPAETPCAPEPAALRDALSSPDEPLKFPGARWVGSFDQALVPGDGQVWTVWTGRPVPSFVPASAPADQPLGLVSFQPRCESIGLVPGPEILALACRSGVSPADLPCSVSRHDPRTGKLLRRYGPFPDVVTAGWAGSDVFVRTRTELIVPDLEWRVDATGEVWGADGALFESDGFTLTRHDLGGGETVKRPIDLHDERVLGVHHEGLLIQRSGSYERPEWELVVWDLATLEETSTRQIGAFAALLHGGHVVVQRPLIDQWRDRVPFTSELLIHDVATGRETAIATFEDEMSRSGWPTVLPEAVIDGELVVAMLPNVGNRAGLEAVPLP